MGLVRALRAYFVAPVVVASAFVGSPFVPEARAQRSPPPCATDPLMLPDPAREWTQQEKEWCLGDLDSPVYKRPARTAPRFSAAGSWLPNSGPSDAFGMVLGVDGVSPSGFSLGLQVSLQLGHLEAGPPDVVVADFETQRYSLVFGWEWKYFFLGPALTYSVRFLTEPEALRGLEYGDNSAVHYVLAPGLQGAVYIPFYAEDPDRHTDGMTIGVKLSGMASFAFPIDYSVSVNNQTVWSMEGAGRYLESQLALGLYCRGSMTPKVSLR